jgi:ribosomal protein S18 acetylase RimI-like enzyme
MIHIVPFSHKLKDHIKTLNYEWLEKYFRVEPNDVVSLSDPQKEIIDKGGHIFYASLNDEIVGVVALLKETEEVFELAKMAVTEKHKGTGAGKLLMEHCLTFAKEHGIKKLTLYSNRSLGSAIHIYKKYGFVETELEPGHYERANIKMLKTISDQAG